MSATGRHGIRLKDDFYQTPPWAFEWFEEHLKASLVNPHLTRPERILEPGAGVGSLVRELHRVWPDATIVAVEKRKECREMLYEAGAEHVIIGDLCDSAVSDQVKGLGPFDLILGNPPYGGPKHIKGVGPNPHYELWLTFIKIGMRMLDLDGRLVFLLRTGILEGRDRNEWLRTHVPDVYVMPKRPKFTGTGSDSATYAWMVWSSRARGDGTIEVLVGACQSRGMMEIPNIRVRWQTAVGPSKVHASAEGHFTACGHLIPQNLATITLGEPAISCLKCQAFMEARAYAIWKEEKRMSPRIKYKGPQGDFIKLYNDLQGIAAQTKGELLTEDIIKKVQSELRDRLTQEVARGAIEAGTVELVVERDPDDPKRLVIDFLPAGDALEETHQDLPPPDPSKGQDEQGLLGKYLVFKVEGTGAPDVLIVGPDGDGGTLAVGAWMKRSKVFVLSPEKDDDYGAASRAAMWAYANAIREKNTQLADDLIAWVKRTSP